MSLFFKPSFLNWPLTNINCGLNSKLKLILKKVPSLFAFVWVNRYYFISSFLILYYKCIFD